MSTSFGAPARFTLRVLALSFIAGSLEAQKPVSKPDTAHSDTSSRPQRLTAVTITTTKTERQAPTAAIVIDAPEIHLTPATSAPDLLRLAADVEVHEQGQGPGFASDASVRGFSSDHSTDLALWVDGVPVNEPVNGHAEGYNDFNLIFPGGIQDIDVIKGPTSALFGNFAMSGVVNVRTVERMQGTDVSATGGAYGRASATMLTGFVRDATSTSGEYSGVLGLHAQREDGFRPNSRNDILQGHGRLVRALNADGRTTIDAGVELYGTDWDSPGYLGEDDFARGAYDIVSNPTDGGYKRRAQERFSIRRVLSPDVLWRTTTYATQGRWQLFLTVPPAGGRFEGLGSQLEEEDSRAGFGLTSALTWNSSRETATLGIEGRYDNSDFQRYFTTDRRRDSTATDLTARQGSGALFAQSATQVTKRLRVDIGLRADALSTSSTPSGEPSVSATNAILSPKVGALVRLTDAVGLYGNVSRGFRSTDGVIEDPTLPLISEWAYETGLKFDGATTHASAAIFRMNVSNEQTFNPITLESVSGGQSVRQGVELEGAWSPMRTLRLASDWTFTDAHYVHLTSGGSEDDPTAPPEVLDGLRVFNTSKYVGVASVDLGPAAQWRVRVSGNWVGQYAPFDEPGVLLGGYGLMHVAGLFRMGKVEWDVGIRNVLNRRYPELVAAEKVAPGQPRAAYATARFIF